MTTKAELAEVYFDNVRNAQIGGQTDGITPETGEDYGYETLDTVLARINSLPEEGIAQISQEPDTHVDVKESPSSSVIDGLRVMDKVVKDIARARSNTAFSGLPPSSRRVSDFARTIDEDPESAQELVRSTVDGSNRIRPTHYERAQFRLNDLATAQQKKANQDGLNVEVTPMSVGQVEHRYFYANSPKEKKAKEKLRRNLGKFVREHS